MVKQVNFLDSLPQPINKGSRQGSRRPRVEGNAARKSFVDYVWDLAGFDLPDNVPYLEYRKNLGQMVTKTGDFLLARANLLAIGPTVPPSSTYQRLDL